MERTKVAATQISTVMDAYSSKQDSQFSIALGNICKPASIVGIIVTYHQAVISLLVSCGTINCLVLHLASPAVTCRAFRFTPTDVCNATFVYTSEIRCAGFLCAGFLTMFSFTVKAIGNYIIELAYNGSREDLDPYVPSDHRPLESNTSSAGALAHLLKASLGSGVLAMPLAFKSAGLMVGTIGTVLIGFICGHVIHILVKTSQQLCVEVKKPCLGYADTCDLVFQNGPKSVRKWAPFARELADWALVLTHAGACCVYIVVVAESFKQVSDVYGGPDWSVTVFCSLTLVILIPLTQITKLKYLVPFSALANFVWLASICVSIYYCLRDPPPIKERNLATSITGIPTFISTSLFAMEGIGVVMPIENEMTKPKEFLGCPGVLNIAMTCVVALYAFVGFSGYLSYGEEVRGSLTLNLPQDEILAQTAKILVACVMILSFALIFYVPVDVVWRRVQDRIPARAQSWSLAGIRLAGTLMLVSLASAIPRLELFMELVGAICLSVLGLLMPAVVETVWLWGKDLGPCHWILVKNLLISAFSIIAMVSGVTYSIKGILDKL